MKASAENGCFIVGVAENLFPIVGIQPVGFGHIERRRQIIHDRIEQRLHTFIFECRSHYHRKYFQRDGRLAQRGAQFVGRDLFAFQKLVQDFVVVLGDGLNQLGMKRFRFLFQFGGNFFGQVFRAHGVVLPDDRLHVDEVDDAAELVFLTDGKLNGDGLGAEALADGIDGMLEISTHLIDLVDEANSWHAVFIGLAPDFFRLRLHPVHRVKHGNSAIQNS